MKYPEIEKSEGLRRATRNLQLNLFRNNVDYFRDLNVWYHVDTVNRKVTMVGLANYKPDFEQEEKTATYKCDFWTMEQFNF